MTTRTILQAIVGWSISSGIIIVTAFAAIQLQFGGSLASFSYIAASRGIYSYLVSCPMFFALYWMGSVIFGKDEILQILKANILLAIALVMFCIVIFGRVLYWFPGDVTNCVDLPSGVKSCDVSYFWLNAFDYGSLILVIASFAVRIIQSRKMAKMK
jgi:hypothetical protein